MIAVGRKVPRALVYDAEQWITITVQGEWQSKYVRFYEYEPINYIDKNGTFIIHLMDGTPWPLNMVHVVYAELTNN